jgi:membrane protease YdiL (CAAX protease family)
MQQLVWTSYGYAGLAGICILGLLAVFALMPRMRGRLLPFARMGRPVWTGSEVFLAICVMVALPDLIVSLLLQTGLFEAFLGPAPDAAAKDATREYLLRCTNMVSPLILVSMLGFVFLLKRIRHPSRQAGFHASCRRSPANVSLGMIAFLIATPIVYGVFTLVTRLIPAVDHPATVLGKHGLADWEWLLLAFQVGVAAPVIEEIVFRGILFDWLRRATLQGHFMVAAMSAAISFMAFDSSDIQAFLAPMFFWLCLMIGYAYRILRMVRYFDLSEDEIRAWRPLPTSDDADFDTARQRQWSEANADLAILGSAMLFAAAHAQNWPAPIPLMLLAIALGWLMRRTQNLIAPITLHVLFNLTSFIALYGMTLAATPANGNAQTTPMRPSPAASIPTSVPASQLPLRK